MKRIILTLAGVLAAVAFAPQASAVPSFARQMGMACSSCHQQHFPVLNKFGQAFKAGGYTMMGAQTKVEGEHLSIPGTLNASMLLKARYQKTNGDSTGTLSGQTTDTGQWQIPDEFSLFFGGRVSENIGFMFEGNTNAPAVLAGFKMPFVFEAGPAKLLVIPYLTDALGASYGFEQASTGAVRGVRWAEHRGDISAQQYVGTDGPATGVAFVALNDMGYINVSRWSPNFTASDKSAIQLRSNYLRIAATPTVGDWAMHIGVQSWSGTNYVATTTTTASIVTGALSDATVFGKVDTKATAVDFQAQGQAAGKDLSVYATWAKAPASTATATNKFNGSLTNDVKAFTLGADYSVIQSTLHIGAAYRNAKNGAADGDNAITLTAVYDLAMNVALHLNHSKRSGSAYNSVPPAPAPATTLTTLMLEAAW